MKGNLSVKQLSLYIKNVFEDELFLQNVTVVGEVFEASMGGKYVFLTLKEDDVTLPCICFKRIILPKIGDKVMLHGSVNFTVKSSLPRGALWFDAGRSGWRCACGTALRVP